MFKFKKIASALASTLMVSSTVALAAAANYPSPFVQNGMADVAVVYGSHTAATADLVGVLNIQDSLNSYVVSGSTDDGTATVEGDAYELFTSSSPLLLNASLSSIRGTVTESNLPTVLADETFTATSVTTDDSTIEATFKIDIGSNPRVIYDNEPTSSDDPTVGILVGANGANYLYNATVTFNKAVNFEDSDSDGEDIMLFGQKFTTASATDGTSIVLFKSADSVFLDTVDTPSQEVIIDGETYVVTLVSADSTTATIKLTDSSGAQAQDEISEGSSKKLLGIEVAVDSASTSSGSSKDTATVILGASRIKLTDGSEVELGTEEDPIEGTQVDFTTTGSGVSTGNVTGITFQVFAEDGSNDFITPGNAFVDPVFGSFKLDFTGLENDVNREMIDVDPSGNDKMVVSLTNWQGNELSNFEWLNNESTAILADSSEWTIKVREQSKINESAYAMVGNEDDGYLVRLRTLTNSSSTTASDDSVVFENVFDTTQSWEASITSEGTGTIDIGGKQYTVNYIDDRSGNNAAYVRLDYPDTTGNGVVVYPSTETDMGAKFMFYEPLTIDLSDADQTGTGKNISSMSIPDGDGYTTITSSILASDDYNFTVTVGSGSAALINTSAAANAQSATGLIGPLRFNITSTGTLNKAKLYLIDPTSLAYVTNPAVVLLEEQDDANNYNAVIVQTGGAGDSNNGIGVSDVDFTWNNDLAMDGSSYGSSGIQYESNDDLYAMMDVWGTLATVDQSTSDQYSLSVSYPDDQVNAMVYVAEDTASISGGSSSGSGSGTTVGVPITDLEISDVAGKNLIVVGGSCVNTVAADLLGSSTPLCGADFTSVTSVGSGEFLIETFDQGDGTIATLVAGYDASDTTNAATYLTTQTVDTTDGMKYVGTTSTSAELVTSEA